MLINEELERQNMTKYRLSKESGVPHTTIIDICSGKAEPKKCAAGTLYRVAKTLGITVEDILQSAVQEYRSSFETFKSNTCHQVKDMGDMEFIIDVLKKDEIRIFYDKGWYPEALYLLAMVDYLSRINELPLCTKYNDIRNRRLEKPIYPTGVILSSEVLKSQEPLRQAERDSIPEFKRLNIYESEVRNVV
ncbi:MAG: helix-turn-helix transcriptional regulator [Lachnospiraceae bacterium]|nr:helix-turn-helix transcriptional regulator [Lachnospiraceae bacterium]